MNNVSILTGRKRELVEFYGPEDAESCVVVMGSGAENCIEVINFMNAQKGKKWAVIKVLLYRPWSHKHFLAKVPKTCKRISVLDKTREEGCAGNPMYLDVL